MGFEEAFRNLMCQDPYPWQKRLYERLINGNAPDALDIPTGLGKTSIIPIWLIALSESMKRKNAQRVPTRLVYIVDRRVIVDQASDTVLHIAKKIEKGADGLPLPSISTLRGGGGVADGREWLRNPGKAAVIIGTVDMIGSRLFFSGYGAGKRIRPFYAGMLGQDSLVVLDETHLSPALERSLADMKEMASNVPQRMRPPQALFMSATRRPTSKTRDLLSLDDEDLVCKAICDRYDAKKTLSLTDAKQDDLPSTITSEALNMTGRTIVYVQKPSDAARITRNLRDAGKDAVMLTGTLRGFERDRLTHAIKFKTCDEEPASREARTQAVLSDNNVLRRSEIFARFVRPPDETRVQCYLVSTSAGEVGVDFDADDMVSDLAPFDSLVQRLGRLNRSGKRSSKAIVVYSDNAIRKNKAVADKLEATLALLKDLAKGGVFDASPRNLAAIPAERTACTLSPSPEIQPLTRDIVDMWSMTSLYKEYAPRPAVHHWLRGRDPHPIPDTYVAWREDIAELVKHDVDTIEDIIDKYPLLPHEMAHSSTFNVNKIRENISSKHGRKKAIIIKYNSDISVKNIGEIDENDLFYSTLLLPSDAGGLDMEGALGSAAERVTDVADDPQYEERGRIRVKISDDGKITLDGDQGGLKDGDDLDEWVAIHKRMKLVRALVTNPYKTEDETQVKELRYYVAKTGSQYSVSAASQPISDHHKEVKEAAASIVKEVGLDPGLADAVVKAAEHHDRGKAHQHWQECMHCDGPEPLAKIAARKRPLNMGGFRHEFESARKISPELDGYKERDLVLHLIAAHHGWARPCFRPNASVEASGEEHRLVMIRYASLQRRFGPWGLAWLEGLLRGADWKASELQGGGR